MGACWLLIYFSLSVITIISYRFAFRQLIYRLRRTRFLYFACLDFLPR
jgi:hypothetical protein